MRTLALGVALALVSGVGCGKKDSKDSGQDTSGKATTDETTPAKAPTPAPKPPPAADNKPETSPEASCAMMTAEEAAEVLGEPVADGKPHNMGCSWDAKSGGTKAVLFEMRPASQFEVAKKITRDMAEKGGPKGSYEDLGEIGESAFYSNLAGHQIVFLVGPRYGQLGLLGPKDDESKARAIDRAKAIAAKMK